MANQGFNFKPGNGNNQNNGFGNNQNTGFPNQGRGLNSASGGQSTFNMQNTNNQNKGFSQNPLGFISNSGRGAPGQTTFNSPGVASNSFTSFSKVTNNHPIGQGSNPNNSTFSSAKPAQNFNFQANPINQANPMNSNNPKPSFNQASNPAFLSSGFQSNSFSANANFARQDKPSFSSNQPSGQSSFFLPQSRMGLNSVDSTTSQSNFKGFSNTPVNPGFSIGNKPGSSGFNSTSFTTQINPGSVGPTVPASSSFGNNSLNPQSGFNFGKAPTSAGFSAPNNMNSGNSTNVNNSLNKSSMFTGPRLDSNQSGFSSNSNILEQGKKNNEGKPIENLGPVDPFMISDMEPGTQCGPTDFIFSESNELKPEEKSFFQAKNFEMFKIPQVPPAKEYC